MNNLKMNKTNKLLRQFINYLELEMLPLNLKVKVFANKKKQTKAFCVVKGRKTVVRIPVENKFLLDPEVSNLSITLQIGKNADKDRIMLSNGSAAAVSYLKLYKDIVDSSSDSSKAKIKAKDLEFYESYFKLARQKWLGEAKN